jgi:glycosyltransferase involved in cell wall biosynthesis
VSALENIAENPDHARQLAQAARAYVSDHLSWDRIIPQWDDLLLGLARAD